MDAGIGRILQALDDDALRANTLVVFMSDNGGDANGRNAPYSGRKGTTYEGGIHVPCIARWPRHLPEGQVVPHVAMTMDVTVSIVRIAGARFPADRPADGIDILAEIEQDRPLLPRQLFWRGRRGEITWRAARDGDLKRVWKQDGVERESWLFDLGNDPAERTNLLADRAEEAARLQTLMADWEREVAPRR